MLHRTIAAMSMAAVLACTAILRAETGDIVERFTFAVANAPKDALNTDGRFQLTIRRWSTDAERSAIAAAAGGDPARLLDSFRNTGGVGHLQWPGGLEYTVRYARRIARPDGGADIVVVADRPLWVWWDTKVKWSTERPFALVHLRVTKDGTGDGRASVTTSVVSDKEAGVMLADSNATPLLTDVRRETAS